MPRKARDIFFLPLFRKTAFVFDIERVASLSTITFHQPAINPCIHLFIRRGAGLAVTCQGSMTYVCRVGTATSDVYYRKPIVCCKLNAVHAKAIGALFSSGSDSDSGDLNCTREEEFENPVNFVGSRDNVYCVRTGCQTVLGDGNLKIKRSYFIRTASWLRYVKSVSSAGQGNERL